MRRLLAIALAALAVALAGPGRARAAAPPPHSKAATAARVAAGVEVWRALRTLNRSRVAKERAAAATALAGMTNPEIGPALRKALARDPSPAVRAAAARSLGRVGGAESVAAVQRAHTRDRDRGVRAAADEVLDELSRLARRVALADVAGDQVNPLLRAQLQGALASGLAKRGYALVESRAATYRLTPQVLAVDEGRDAAGIKVEVRASVRAIDGAGRVVAMVEGGARASADPAATSPTALTGQALAAAARGLCDDLAKRLPSLAEAMPPP